MLAAWGLKLAAYSFKSLELEACCLMLAACCLRPGPVARLLGAVALVGLMAWSELLRAGELPEHARSSLTALRFANSFPAFRNSL